MGGPQLAQLGQFQIKALVDAAFFSVLVGNKALLL